MAGVDTLYCHPVSGAMCDPGSEDYRESEHAAGTPVVTDTLIYLHLVPNERVR